VEEAYISCLFLCRFGPPVMPRLDTPTLCKPGELNSMVFKAD